MSTYCNDPETERAIVGVADGYDEDACVRGISYRRSLAHLSPRLRFILLARDEGDYTWEHIGELLGAHPRTVHNLYVSATALMILEM